MSRHNTGLNINLHIPFQSEDELALTSKKVYDRLKVLLGADFGTQLFVDVPPRTETVQTGFGLVVETIEEPETQVAAFPRRMVQAGAQIDIERITLGNGATAVKVTVPVTLHIDEAELAELIPSAGRTQS